MRRDLPSPRLVIGFLMTLYAVLALNSALLHEDRLRALLEPVPILAGVLALVRYGKPD